MSVEAPLHNGQLYSWREIESYPTDRLGDANLPGTWDLRGYDLSRVITALHRLVGRHEALRTTYHPQNGKPVQRVESDSTLPIERIDRPITDLGDPERTTVALTGRPIEMTGGLCWRAELVSTNDVPMFLALSFSHLILDVWSTQELQSQFAALLADPDARTPLAPSPTELAARQREPGWASRQRSAERYWRTVLDDDLIHRFRTLPSRAEGRRIQATLHSHRLGELTELAARRHGVTAPTVLLALVTAAIAEHVNAERFAMSLMSSNRFSAEHQHAVGTLNQLIPVVITVDDRRSLAEHITGPHWASAKAYRHSCYDVDRIAELAGAGFPELFPCWFNYLRLDGAPPSRNDRTPAELVRNPARPFGQPFDVRVSVRGGRTSIAVRTDPDVLSEPALVELLRTVAYGTERAVTDPAGSLKDLRGVRDLPPELFPATA